MKPKLEYCLLCNLQVHAHARVSSIVIIFWEYYAVFENSKKLNDILMHPE